MMKKVLVTGGAGFIGSNFLRYMVNKYPDYLFLNLDCLTYAGNLENLIEIALRPNYHFILGDISNKTCVDELVQGGIDWVVNFAAESHVDRSIVRPDIFIQTNIVGTQVLLEAAKKYGVSKFVQISTDEVYGSLGTIGKFTEETCLDPHSPYSVSKASADFLVAAYHQTFGLNVNITRSSNNFGPYQYPEKLIPLFITNALQDLPLPIYGDGLNVRDWLYVEDHCRAIDLVLHQGRNGEIYNIGGNHEMTNLEITQLILQELSKPLSLIRFIHDRPGHDRRYAINPAKISRELGFRPIYDFEQGLKNTIRWYCEHEDWWKKIKEA